MFLFCCSLGRVTQLLWEMGTIEVAASSGQCEPVCIKLLKQKSIALAIIIPYIFPAVSYGLERALPSRDLSSENSDITSKIRETYSLVV